MLLRERLLHLRSDESSDPLNVLLPEAAARDQVVEENDELHITGFIRDGD